MDIKDIKEQIIKAGEKAVIQLIKVAKEDIIKYDKDDELAADRLKNAAATKKLAIFDAFEWAELALAIGCDLDGLVELALGGLGVAAAKGLQCLDTQRAIIRRSRGQNG